MDILLGKKMNKVYNTLYKPFIKCKNFRGLVDILIKLQWLIGTKGNWKKNKSWEPFWKYQLPAKMHCQSSPYS